MAELSQPVDEIWADEAHAVAAPAARTPGAQVVAFLRGPYPTLLSRLVLGGVFLLAGLSKLGVPALVATTIDSYALPLPAALVQAIAVGLPPLEVGVGLWLLAGLLIRPTAAVSGGLVLVFLVALGQAALRGIDADCGCFAGPGGNPLGLTLIRALGPVGTWLTTEKVGISSVLRDSVFMLMALHLILVPSIFSVDHWRAARRQAAVEAAWAAETVDDATAA